MTHLPCLDVKLEHELLLLQTFLIIAQLGLLTDDWQSAGWLLYISREQNKGRTDDGFPVLLDFERAFAIPDQKREVEQVLDGLRKVVRVSDEFEKVDRTVLLHEQVSNLENARGGKGGKGEEGGGI